MRLIAWNCNMALHRKYEALLSLAPDIAVISECAEPETVQAKLKGQSLPTEVVWVGQNQHKGLAVLAFNDYKVSLLDSYDSALRYIMPVSIGGPHAFNLMAVWAQNASAGITRKDQPGPFRTALDQFKDLFTTSPTVAAGDFNNNVIWDRPGWPINQADAIEILATYGLVSAYHAVMHEAQGQETIPTHYWRDRKKDGPTYHLDYIFMPRDWVNKLNEMSVGTFEDWCGNKLSDHVPVVIDVEL